MKTFVLILVAGVAAMIGVTQAWAADISGEVLAAHNELRAKHGVPPLTWSAKLATSAQVSASLEGFRRTRDSGVEASFKSMYGHANGNN